IPDLADSEKRYRYLDGLQSNLRLEFRSAMDTVQFDELAKAALAVDNIAFTTRARQNATQNRPRPAPPVPSSGPTPMDIDATTVTKKDNKTSNGTRKPLTAADKKYLIANKGCFYCRKINVDHRVPTCPDKIAADKAKQVKVNSVSAAASSTASSTPKSGNGSTQN
ncbi:hypothetical protein HK104_006220, partial [Borealophlyctis nickersoniae]